MTPAPPSDTPVLVAAGGAGWETTALEQLTRRGAGTALHKRCVDLSDLLASAATGLARAALVSSRLPGLDADTVATLARAGVGTVVVLDDDAGPEARARLHRLGVADVLPAELGGLSDALRGAATPAGRPESATGAATGPASGPGEPPPAAGQSADGRTVVVWGPAGAPGRTTVATGLAAEAAHRGRDTVLVDADPYGGAVAQHLGILDGASGLLAAARAANAGELDAVRLAGLARTVGGGLRVLTGLPRPDRWRTGRRCHPRG